MGQSIGAVSEMFESFGSQSEPHVTCCFVFQPSLSDNIYDLFSRYLRPLPVNPLAGQLIPKSHLDSGKDWNEGANIHLDLKWLCQTDR